MHNVLDSRVSRSKEELEKAYALVYKEYFKRGYAKENPSVLKYSIYNVLPQTTTLIAIVDNKNIIATTTIVPDSPLGLPMDKIYHRELNHLRSSQAKLCEITMLVSDANFYKDTSVKLSFSKIYFILYFFKVFLDYARDIMDFDFVCIAINPTNKLAFGRVLFKDLDGLKFYPDVNNAPAIAEYHDLRLAKEGFTKMGNERLYNIFVRNDTPPEKFANKFVFSAGDLRYFFVEKSDIFKTATRSQMDYIKSCYPAYDWNQILK